MTDPGTRPTVLVVDADEDTLELLGEYLGARGMEVLTAYAAEEAIALVRSAPVDAVLTEIGGGSSGLELIHAARSRARPAAVVATMVRDTVELAVAAMKSGASDVLRKPYRLQGVFDALHAALDHRVEWLANRAASERLLFYEAAGDLSDLSEMSRLYGLLAQVARSACRADEVAVWRPGPSGWSAVARGGRVDALGGVDPAKLVASGPFLDERVAATPLRDRQARLRGVLALAGGVPRQPEDLEQMGRLCRVVVDAMERVERV